MRNALLLTSIALLCTASLSQDNPSGRPPEIKTPPDIPYRVGGKVSAPRVVYAPDPEYSQEASKAGLEGTLVLWIVVGPDGRPHEIRVQRALGMGLDEKAIEAVRTWKFEPARLNGTPVAVQINVEVNFRRGGPGKPAGTGITSATTTQVTQQQPMPADAPSREEILRLMDVMHVREQTKQLLSTMSRQIRARMAEESKKHTPAPTQQQQDQIDAAMDEMWQSIPIDDLLDAMVPSYQRHLTKADLDGMLQFYNSPVGQKLLHEMPAIMAESMQTATEVTRQQMAAVTKKFQDRITQIMRGDRFGTGFFVDAKGHVLTNDHMVAGCKTIQTRDGSPLHVVSSSAASDLALLRLDVVPSAFAVFRTGPPPRPGDSVVAFGFPLHGVLSSEGNVSTGAISATAGLKDDVRFIQISAPVQPGNSGGPLLDSSGHVIGVVVGKLDALRVARITGDVPQNINFAVHWAEVKVFLHDAGVAYREEPSSLPLNNRDTASIASQISISIQCSE